MAGNKPIEKFKCGSVEAAIFENTVSKGDTSFTLRKAVIQRNYLDKNDTWQSTSSLDVNDIPKAMLVLSKAYDFMTTKEVAREKREELD